MFEQEFPRFSFGKIECIKLFRSISNMGLVEAKNMTEAFLNLHESPDYIPNKEVLQKFVRVAVAASAGKIICKDGKLFNIISTPLTIEDSLWS